jgi:hypothetical protein
MDYALQEREEEEEEEERVGKVDFEAPDGHVREDRVDARVALVQSYLNAWTRLDLIKSP